MDKILRILLLRVLQLNVIGCGVFHTLLLLVPVNTRNIQYSSTSAILGTSQFKFFLILKFQCYQINSGIFNSMKF